MPNPAKPIVLSAAFLVAIAIDTNAGPLARTGDNLAGSVADVPSSARQLPGHQIATLPQANAAPTPDSIALPGVLVVAPYWHPYTSSLGAKASSNGKVKAEHYQTPTDYLGDIAMHPYTSRFGPKTSSNGALRVEHFQVPADYEVNVAMHPYTSRIGPPVEGGQNRPGDLQATTRLHDNR
jgi:hypothetical protein